jgi:hypothetical protein
MPHLCKQCSVVPAGGCLYVCVCRILYNQCHVNLNFVHPGMCCMSSMFVQMVRVCWLFAGSSLYGFCVCVCVCMRACVVYNVTLTGAGRVVMFVVLCMQILFLYDFLYFHCNPCTDFFHCHLRCAAF